MKFELRGHILPPVRQKTQPNLTPDSTAPVNAPPRAKNPHWLVDPRILALIVVLVNAVKPVTVDDTAYLTYARQIATHPLDPYGFTFFWYTFPENAFEILIPPVLPYWLALGIKLLGEHPALLKLWMYPFLFLFAWSVRELLRRFAKGSQDQMLPLIVLSPAILPTVNLMLDVPAIALGLAALVAFIRATVRSSWLFALVSGLIAGLAMQTKYTALLIPPAIALFGLTHRKCAGIKLGTISVFTAGIAFSLWEILMAAKYGRSHFLFHASTQQPSSEAGLNPIEAFIEDKKYLVAPLAGYLGCLGIGAGLLAASALGLSRRALKIVACFWACGFFWIALTPAHWSTISVQSSPDATTFVLLFWQSTGSLILFSLMATACLLTFRIRKTLKIRGNADSLFLAGWLILELAGYFVLTPFGAARRVIGLATIGGLLAARAVSRFGRIGPNRGPSSWTSVFAVAVGFLMAAIDTFDAYPEKICAERAVAMAEAVNPSAKVWFAGHWGFQYYCTRAGANQIVPGESILAPGDVLILPEHPDAKGFYRPHIGEVAIHPPVWAVEKIQEMIWDDYLAAQTVPNFYGGVNPLIGRDHPRLKIVVYHVICEWKVPR